MTDIFHITIDHVPKALGNEVHFKAQRLFFLHYTDRIRRWELEFSSGLKGLKFFPRCLTETVTVIN